MTTALRQCEAKVEAARMPARAFNRSEFEQGPAPVGEPLQLLCHDEKGEYVLPFQCERREDGWYRIGKSRPIEAKVIGWRTWHR